MNKLHFMYNVLEPAQQKSKLFLLLFATDIIYITINK